MSLAALRFSSTSLLGSTGEHGGVWESRDLRHESSSLQYSLAYTTRSVPKGSANEYIQTNKTSFDCRLT